jgi:hypothetical protein
LCLGSGLHCKGFSFPVNFLKIGYFGSKRKGKEYINYMTFIMCCIWMGTYLEDMDRLVGQVKLLYQLIGKANVLLKKVTKTKKHQMIV